MYSKPCVDLRPGDGAAIAFVAAAAALTALAVVCSLRPALLWLMTGQAVLALALVLWLVILHEAGHETLFRTRWLNEPMGHLAGFFALVPFASWRAIHARHHKWTGWQDLDPTTAVLVPRPLGRAEKLLLNVCWRYWIPLFSLLYRVTFWSPARLRRTFALAAVLRPMLANAAVLAAAYLGLGWLAGPRLLLRVVAPGLLLALVLEDMLLLSQHTHVPQRRSGGLPVAAFPATEQGPFTRSLRLPSWLSLLLLHFDAHELHHRHPAVPGYRLRRLPTTGAVEVSWWRWLSTARRIPGEVFFFQDREQSGIRI